jgi:hypothetical protein
MLEPRPGLFNFRAPATDGNGSATTSAPPDSGASFADKVLAKLGLVSQADATSTDTDVSEPVKFRQTMNQAGYLAAGHHNGTPNGLEVNLTRILSNLHEEFDQNHKEQETARKQKQAEINTVDTEIAYRQDERETFEKRIEKRKAEIGELKQEIHTLRSSPEDMHLPEPSRLTLWISGIILAMLTIYLFVFYSSAIYSAFYKEFKPEDGVVVRAIFDSQAIPNALKDGFTELVMMVTLPAAFLGLGYLIHKFLEEKHWVKYLKVLALLLTTFVFDGILAYEISEKIYDLKRLNDFNSKLPPYDLSIAVSDIKVWMILFAGFVVYIIWGFVFDYFIESSRLNNKVASAISERQEKIAEAEKEVAGWEAQIVKLKEAIRDLTSQRHRLEAQLLGVLIPAREWASYLMEYCGGWLKWMAGAGVSLNKQNQCKATLDQFVERHLGQETVLSYRASGLGQLPLDGPAPAPASI